jgi:hypothetical protein
VVLELLRVNDVAQLHVRVPGVRVR